MDGSPAQTSISNRADDARGDLKAARTALNDDRATAERGSPLKATLTHRQKSSRTAGGDVVGQDVAAPAVLQGRGGVPEALLLVLEPFQQDDVVAPWQLCNRQLHDCRLGPRLRQGAHVLEVAG